MVRLGWVLLGICMSPAILLAQPPGGAGKVDGLLERVAPACLGAKESKDLEKLTAELGELSQESRQSLEMPRASKIDAAVMFVRRWSEYLRAYKAGQKKKAFEILGNLLEDRSWLGLVPRSEVLERYAERSKFYYVRYDTRTIEDFQKAVKKFKEMEKEADAPGMMRDSIEPLEKVLSLWEAQTEGNVVRLENACRPDPLDRADVSICKQLVLAQVVARHLQLGTEYARTPAESESAAKFLAAQIQLAREKRDLVALWRMETYRAFLTRDESAWSKDEIKSIGHCLEGRKLEASGKSDAAAVQYRLALHVPCSEIPRKFAEERLREIGKENPEALQSGVAFVGGRAEPLVMDRSGRMVPQSIAERYNQLQPPPYMDRHKEEPWYLY